MDGFNDAFGPPTTTTNNNSEELENDPAAEFLAREQSNLAGLEDDTEESGTILMLDSAEPLGLESSTDPVTNSFPIVTNGISAEHDDRRSPSPLPVTTNYSDIPREEPEKIKRWREEQKARLEKKDEEEEKKKQEMREAAKKELDEWYSSHEEQVAKNRNANRSAERELVADTEPMEPGTEWERIAKLCDFNPKGSKHSKDISRMRSIILQVKQTPPVPSITSRK